MNGVLHGRLNNNEPLPFIYESTGIITRFAFLWLNDEIHRGIVNYEQTTRGWALGKGEPECGLKITLLPCFGVTAP